MICMNFNLNCPWLSFRCILFGEFQDVKWFYCVNYCPWHLLSYIMTLIFNLFGKEYYQLLGVKSIYTMIVSMYRDCNISNVTFVVSYIYVHMYISAMLLACCVYIMSLFANYLYVLLHQSHVFRCNYYRLWYLSNWCDLIIFG